MEIGDSIGEWTVVVATPPSERIKRVRDDFGRGDGPVTVPVSGHYEAHRETASGTVPQMAGEPAKLIAKCEAWDRDHAALKRNAAGQLRAPKVKPTAGIVSTRPQSLPLKSKPAANTGDDLTAA